MQLKRTVLMVTVGGACAAWLAAAATSGRRMPPPAQAPAGASIDARAAALDAEIARLRDRVQPTASRRETTRNPFAFVVHRATAPAAPARVAEVAATPIAVAAGPVLKLDGIAEDAGPDGPVRSAIISAGTELFIVKEGEAVTSRYRVTKISADVVELFDAIANQSVRIALR